MTYYTIIMYLLIGASVASALAESGKIGVWGFISTTLYWPMAVAYYGMKALVRVAEED